MSFRLKKLELFKNTIIFANQKHQKKNKYETLQTVAFSNNYVIDSMSRQRKPNADHCSHQRHSQPI